MNEWMLLLTFDSPLLPILFHSNKQHQPQQKQTNILDDLNDSNVFSTTNAPDPNPNEISSKHNSVQSNANHTDNSYNKESDTKTGSNNIINNNNNINNNSTATTVTSTQIQVQSTTVNSSTLPNNLSVELRKIQQSAGLISSNNNCTFISKHIYSTDKLQTGNSLMARIPAPNVTVIDKNGENIRILKRVPDSSSGSGTTHTFDNSVFKSGLSSLSRSSNLSSSADELMAKGTSTHSNHSNLSSAPVSRTTQSITFNTNTSSTTSNIYDQHIRVLTPIEIMRTLPSLHDHEMASNESQATSNFALALSKSRRATITCLSENSNKDASDTMNIDSNSSSSEINKATDSNDNTDNSMDGKHYQNVHSVRSDEAKSPILVSSTQMRSNGSPQQQSSNRNSRDTNNRKENFDSFTSSQPSSTGGSMTMVRDDKRTPCDLDTFVSLSGFLFIWNCSIAKLELLIRLFSLRFVSFHFWFVYFFFFILLMESHFSISFGFHLSPKVIFRTDFLFKLFFFRLFLIRLYENFRCMKFFFSDLIIIVLSV